MEPGRPSATAERAAVLRAVHRLLDHPMVLDDPLAFRLIGAERTAELRGNLQAFEAPALRHLRASIALRSRYAEDGLCDAVRRGARQYVILGAGLDSFAYRNPFAATDLHVYEVDHPETQVWKRHRLGAAGIELPASLTFVPVDFETETLPTVLDGSGFDPGVRTFVSWLGVTVYLTREAVMDTLVWAASLTPGSEIVFEYGIPRASLGAGARVAAARFAGRAAEVGEPWITFFEPAALAAEVRRLGFAYVEDLGPVEAMARYFPDRSDGLRPGSAHLMTARLAD